ncbi:MAG: hypothetical protein ACOCQD_00260 [archaeon]
MGKLVNKENKINVTFVVSDAANTEVTIPDYLPSIGQIEGADAITLSDDTPNVFSSQNLDVVTDADSLDSDQISAPSSRSIRIGNSYDSDSGALVNITYTMK